MPLSLKGPLASVTMKLLRANDHLRGIRQVEAKFGAVACQVVFTEDRDKDLGYFVVHLPEPPLELSSMVGDCLHNFRATLDYLVWRMVMCNPPNEPDSRNMFPICTSPDNFAGQVKRGRLQGVPEAGAAIIEKMQPYDSTHHPLVLLDNLCNADKHRDLHLTTAVASDLDISFSRDGEVYLRTILGNDEVRNGTILGNIGVSLSKVPSRPQVEVHGQAVAFVAFKDLLSESGEAVSVGDLLEEMRDHIADTVIPSLEPFIYWLS